MGGCTASKLDSEDTVRRCKERRRLIKDADYARHQLAAAQSDYSRSLRLTGTALADFAAGEPFSVSDQTPAVLLHTHSSPSASSYSVPTTFSADRVPPQRSTFYSSTAAESVRSMPKRSNLRSVSSVSPSGSVLNDRFKRRVGKPVPKLPHILSESSVASSMRKTKSSNFHDDYRPTAAAYDGTASQTSSVWNWENFYPPSPPGFEYFDRIERQRVKRESFECEKSKYRNIHQSSEEEDEDEEEVEKEEGKDETDYLREEVHCSDWGDHYSTTSSSNVDNAGEHIADGDDDLECTSEIESRSNFGSSMRSEFIGQGRTKYETKSMKSDVDGVSSVSYGDMRIVVRHKNLVEIVAAIRDNFDKAAEAGEKVSDMLGIGRAQLDKSFRQLKSMSALTV